MGGRRKEGGGRKEEGGGRLPATAAAALAAGRARPLQPRSAGEEHSDVVESLGLTR